MRGCVHSMLACAKEKCLKERERERKREREKERERERERARERERERERRRINFKMGNFLQNVFPKESSLVFLFSYFKNS